jgi:hypothetical protein
VWDVLGNSHVCGASLCARRTVGTCDVCSPPRAVAEGSFTFLIGSHVARRNVGQEAVLERLWVLWVSSCCCCARMGLCVGRGRVSGRASSMCFTVRVSC